MHIPKYLLAALCALLAAALVFCGFLLLKEDDAPPVNEQYEMGMQYWSQSRYEEAIAMMDQAAQAEPENARIYFCRCDSYIQLAEQCEAAESAWHLVDLAEENLQELIAREGITAETEKLTSRLRSLRELLSFPEETAPEETVEETTEAAPEETAPEETQNHNVHPNDPTQKPGAGSPSYDPTVSPIPDEDYMPSDDPVVIIPPVPDYEEDPVVTIPPASDAEGSPSHNPTVLPDTSDDMVDLGSPTD